MGDEKSWYAIQTYSGHENKVKKNLEQRIESMGMNDFIFQVLIPTEQGVEIKNGKRITVERKVFPGYMVVEMVMNPDSWFVVRNTPSVMGFIGTPAIGPTDREIPTPLTDDEVKKIIRSMGVEAPKPRAKFLVGDAVRITDGPFTDFVASVETVDVNRGKLKVLVSMFGRETPVELDFLQVENERI